MFLDLAQICYMYLPTLLFRHTQDRPGSSVLQVPHQQDPGFPPMSQSQPAKYGELVVLG